MAAAKLRNKGQLSHSPKANSLRNVIVRPENSKSFTSRSAVYRRLLAFYDQPQAKAEKRDVRSPYFGFFLGKIPAAPVPPVLPETDCCIAPFAALAAIPPTSGTKLGLDVVP